MGATEPLPKYVARAKEIQNQLRATGYTISDQEVAWALLAGLPPAYDTVVTVLETSTDKDISLDEILPKLMPVEQRMYYSETERSRTTESAFTANETRTCFYCGKKGHLQRNCSVRKRDQARNGTRMRKMEHNYGAIAL